MRREGKFLFLGSGASGGVPVVGCSCQVCSSDNPKNKRLRSSGLLSFGSTSMLIDAGPDFRQQALLHKIDSIDAVLITHTHYDHVGGLEELRVFTLDQERPLPCYVSHESMESIQRLFYYHFEHKNEEVNKRAEFDFRVLEGKSGAFSLGDTTIHFFRYFQGAMPVLGIRVGDFAYVTDIKKYDETVLEALQGVRTLVTSALRVGPSTFQMTVDEAVSFIDKVGAKEAYLMHLSHEIEYEQVKRTLPPHIQLAYDGLERTFSW